MAKIHTIIDGLLKQLDIPFYDGMPLFDDEGPSLYAVYSVWEVPLLYGDGTVQMCKYIMSLHFFCSGQNLTLCEEKEEQAKKLLLDNDWCYMGSQTPSFGTSEPQERHIVYNYNTILEV